MYYVIMGQDVPDSLERRLQARPEHLSRLEALRDAGRLLLAGPFPAVDSPDPGPAGFTGSLIVAEFPSLDDARAWANADPYVAAGVTPRFWCAHSSAFCPEVPGIQITNALAGWPHRSGVDPPCEGAPHTRGDNGLPPYDHKPAVRKAARLSHYLLESCHAPQDRGKPARPRPCPSPCWRVVTGPIRHLRRSLRMSIRSRW
jgi:uncharacterized protein